MDPANIPTEDVVSEVNDLYDFADDTNKRLHAQLRALERKAIQIDGEVKDTVDRTATMREHLANVRAESHTTQQLIDARSREIDTENHLKQLAEREKARFAAELRKHQGELADLQDKLNSAQNAMFRGNEKLDEFKLRMSWNQEELEQWVLASRQKEEDALAIAKYTKQDEGKLRELNLQIERMMAEVQKKRTELDEEVTETQAQQIVLDKTAEDFRRLHSERQALIRQWDEAVKNLRRREKDIEAAGETFAEVKADLRARQAQLQEREAELAAQERENSAVEAQIVATERELALLRQKQADSTQGFDDISDRTELTKNALSKEESELRARREECKALAAAIDKSQRILDRKKRAIVREQEQVDAHRSQSMTLEQVTKQVEEMAKDAEARADAAERTVRELKGQSYKESERLHSLQRDRANLHAEISGAERTARTVSAHIRELDDKAQRQREVVYNADFKLQLLERRLARMQGQRTEAEKRDLTKRIRELTEEVEAATAQHSMLTTQLKRLRNDLAAANRREEALGREESKLDTEINELNLRNQTSTQHLKALVAKKEERMVAHDVLKLEVSKLREHLGAAVDEVYGLENRLAQLRLSMDERTHEIGVHGDVLKAQLKAAEDERHRAARVLSEKELHIEKLQKKYEVVAGRSLPPEDGAGIGAGDGATNSQAFYIIRAAQVGAESGQGLGGRRGGEETNARCGGGRWEQEREELQREGDELDQAINSKLMELAALEATVEQVYRKNAAYKASLASSKASGPLQEQKAILDEQYHKAVSRFRAARVEERELQEGLDAMAQSREAINQVRIAACLWAGDGGGRERACRGLGPQRWQFAPLFWAAGYRCHSAALH